jgi:purine-binding chemotaxis protein CheW
VKVSDELAYCTFHLDGLFFGVEVLKVQEVIRYQRMTTVPLAPSVVRGVINLRGQVVTAIDLRRRLQMPDRADGQLPINVIVRTEDGPVSLLVDEIGDVIDVHDANFEPAPETVGGAARELVRGVYKLDGRLLLVLDVDTALRPHVVAGADAPV